MSLASPGPIIFFGTPEFALPTLEALVDTGASYLALPRSLLTGLGYRAVDRQRVVFATGQTAVWEVAEV
ncbi:MAG: aspartyl protease family protein, partial [Thermoanaerobaculia bacterium]